MNTMQKLWKDEAGLILSAELALVLTIGVLSMIVGLNAIAGSLNHELNDIAGAFGTIDQTYAYEGFVNPRFGRGGACGVHAFARGSAYFDAADDCDCAEITSIGPAGKSDVGGSLGSAVGESGAAAGGPNVEGVGGGSAFSAGGAGASAGLVAPDSGDLQPTPNEVLPGPGARTPNPCNTPDCQ